MLPGVSNTVGQLKNLARLIQREHAGLEVEIRTWGPALQSLHNLQAYDANLTTARNLALEIANHLHRHQGEDFYLLGYSGGGGLAVLTAANLPDGARIDRLILIAPAISPEYPLAEQVLPHVREFVVNCASRRDRQVGSGTRWFGTVDRKLTRSAGCVGFALAHPHLVEYHWTPRIRELRHMGGHTEYLGARWQEAILLPVFDADSTPERLRASYAVQAE